MKVPVEGTRSTIEDTAAGLRLVIPARRNWFAFLFLFAWLGGWAMGEVSAIGALFGIGPMAGGRRNPAPVSAFMAFWLVAWTIGGATAIYAWLWMLSGREVIELDGTTFSIARQPIPIPRKAEYDWAQVRNLRVVPLQGRRDLTGMGGGIIAFDYGAKTFRFGSGLDEAEASMLVAAITQRFPGRNPA